MTTHGVAGHFPEFFESFTLGGDGMAQGDGNVSAVHLILPHFKDDVVFVENIARQEHSEQGTISRHPRGDHTATEAEDEAVSAGWPLGGSDRSSARGRRETRRQ